MRLLTILTVLLTACRSKDADIDSASTSDTGPTSGTIDADGDGYDESEDCDESSGLVNPGAEEICDGVDNNCDGNVDEGVMDWFYADEDADGFGDPDRTVEACEAPSGYISTATDCDDDDPKSYPGAAERCDGVDNDCDEEIDEDVLTAWYADADGDGYGAEDALYKVCDPPPGYVEDSSDCDDTEANAYPGAEEICDGVDNDCNGDVDEDVTVTFYQDADGDGVGVSDITTESCTQPTGYATEAGDCLDTDASISPNALEICDETDNDCDGTTDEADAVDAETFYADDDGDGFGDVDTSTVGCTAPSGHVADSTDCDDGRGDVNPSATELCDEIDNNCDGDVDDDDPDLADATTWYADADKDGHGSSTYTVDACDMPSGYVADNTDCDDTEGSINPDASERCDEVDNDCDGDIDDDDSSLTSADTWFADSDGDGYGDVDSTATACLAPSGYVADSTDCDDGLAAINPSASEVCDEVDNDCDGDIDDDDSSLTGAETFYADADSDGYGSTAYTITGCVTPSGYVADSTDCDDTESSVYPSASEICDGLDNDCDGDTDTDDGDLSDAETFYADADGDGYGSATYTTTDCTRPTGYVTDDTDCDDTDEDAYPGAEEVCDGADNNCDGDADDGVLGGAEECAASDCLEILEAGDDDGDGLYWIDPDGDGLDAWEAYCDMTTDGGGWTRVYASLYPTWWSSSDWEDVGYPEDDDYSALAWRDDFVDADGVWTFRFEVGNSGTWDSASRAHYTIWTQEHDPFDDTTDGSDYTFIDGEESTTCDGFNGLHDRYYTDSGVYAMSSDVDNGDSVGCWWMQIVPLQQYSSSSSYPGYLEGYDGPNTHTWHVLWMQ